jgi:hypothetical protein
MERYNLEEVMSGLEDSCLWVTLGFSSRLIANDVLHIVCATTANLRDRELGTADLYLERFEQAYSCYGGAEQITATPSSVQIRLNKKGSDALCFKGAGVWFSVPNDLANYTEALRILQQMTALEHGKRLVVDIR